jgi:hypothetical protein
MKKLIPSLTAIAAFILLGVGMAANAFANVTYTYTGKNMETWFDGVSGIGLPPPYPIADPLSFSLTFSDNGTSLLDWSVFQSRIGTITKLETQNMYGGLSPIIGLRSSSTGEVTSWYASVDRPSTTGYSASFLSFNGQLGDWLLTPPYDKPPYPNAWDMVVIPAGDGSGRVTYWAGNTNATSSSMGTWTSNGNLASLHFYQGAVQQVASVPEPETYAMLLAGLGLVGFSARRRKDSAA